MAVISVKLKEWGGGIDESGHRTYKAIFQVVTDDPDDGPAIVLQAPGLPTVGSFWNPGNDVDVWAFCLPETEVEPVVKGEKDRHWHVTKTFSTHPPDSGKRCSEETIEDPLLEPPKISGSFGNYTEEAVRDRFGRAITNSAHEVIRGSVNEWDASRPGVSIEINTASLNLALLSAIDNTLNSVTMWGFPPRCIKVKVQPWEKKYYGQCYVYFTLKLLFECKINGWDRNISDEGTKVLKGHWASNGTWTLDNIGGQPPNPNNPSHFILAKDFNADPVRMPLNGAGLPALVAVSDANQFMSIVAGNTGNSLEDTTKWIPTTISTQLIPEEYSANFYYVRGNVVLYLGNYHIANTDNKGANPNTSLLWTVLSSIPSVDRGTFDLTVTYAAGDYIEAAFQAGNIHVEKYNEYNFLLLGVPTVVP